MLHGMRYKGTPLVAAMSIPWKYPKWPVPVGQGQFLGFTMRTNEPVFIDTWWLMLNRYIEAPTVLVLALRNAGKSTILKSWGRRGALGQGRVLVPQDLWTPEMTGKQIVERIRVHWDSRRNEEGRSEYGPVCDSVGGKTIYLADGVAVNLFDPGLSEEQVLMMAIEIARIVGESTMLSDSELFAMQVAAFKMHREWPDAQSTHAFEAVLESLDANDVSRYRGNIDEQRMDRLGSQFSTTERANKFREMLRNLPARDIPEVVKAAQGVAEKFGNVIRGEFGRTFDGTTSMRDLSRSAGSINWDWTDTPESTRTLLSFMRWKTHEMAANANDFGAIPHMLFSDEEHEALRNPMYARQFLASMMKVREAHRQMIVSTQKLTGLTTAGAENSELRRTNEAIAKSFGMYIFGQQPVDASNRKAIMDLGVSESDAYILEKLSMGQVGIYLADGGPVHFVNIKVTPSDMALIQTNRSAESMEETVHPMDIAEVKDRASNFRATSIEQASVR